MKKIITILIIAFIFLGAAGCKNMREINFIINSTPDGADVYINGTLKGKTPLTVILSIGEYKLEVKREDYKDKKINLVIDKNSKSIDVILTEKMSFNINLDVQYLNPLMPDYSYAVYLDDKFTKQVTPCILKGVSKGIHTIRLVSVENIYEKKLNLEKDAKFTLRDFKQYPGFYALDLKDYSGRYTKPMKWIVFSDNKPLVDVCCSAAGIAYSNIFVNETLNISGYIEKEAPIDSFDIVFPSGKKVHITTVEKNGHKIFSKKVTFDELGRYTMDEGSSSSNVFYRGCSPFNVLYKATPLPPAKTVEELFGPSMGKQINGAVAIPENTEQTIALFITDADGKPVINKPIGKYNVKTDARGIVTLKVKGKCGFDGITVNGKNVGVRLYGYLLGWVYHTTVLDTKDVDIKYIDGDIYIPENQVRGYFSLGDIQNTKEINKKVYADLDTLKSGAGASIVVTNDKIKFLKMCDMIP